MNYNKNKPSQLFGFSYVEMMIVLMIMVILFSVGMANYRGFQRRQSLEAAVRQVRADLSLAREYALAGRKTCTVAVPPHTLLGYRFNVDSSAQYTISAVCDDGSSFYFSVAKTTQSPGGFTIANVPEAGASQSYVDFRTVSKGVDVGTGGSRWMTFTLTSTGDSSLTQDIIVTLAGEIR